MIKKHFIACSGMLVLMVLAKLFIFSTPSDRQKSTFKFGDSPRKDSSTDSFIASMSFANETVPSQDPNVVKRIRKELKAYSHNTMQTSKLHQNAKRWFPIVESMLKVYGIPDDFKYIPLVESGFESGTSSYRGASGYWQFMPGTARTYGLRVDKNVDERQDIRRSTIAACKYLKSLYMEFNDWTLVAAAYNIGETNLKRQMIRQRQDNYFKMKLNRETGSYVYKLISMKEIIENPVQHGYAKPIEARRFINSDFKHLYEILPLADKPAVVKPYIFYN